jgi:hypothetical protein
MNFMHIVKKHLQVYTVYLREGPKYAKLNLFFFIGVPSDKARQVVHCKKKFWCR